MTQLHQTKNMKHYTNKICFIFFFVFIVYIRAWNIFLIYCGDAIKDALQKSHVCGAREYTKDIT